MRQQLLGFKIILLALFFIFMLTSTKATFSCQLDICSALYNLAQSNQCTPCCIPITKTVTISSPGLYVLKCNVTAQITITTSDVQIELNGFTLSNSGNPIITINSDLSNIAIRNGLIKGSLNTNDGIAVASGTSDVQFKSVTFIDCKGGILFDGTENSKITCCEVKHCKFKNCNKGIFARYIQKCNFFDCLACCCNQFGFKFLYSNFNKIEACTTLDIDNENPAGDALGFASHGGHGNLFKGCAAEGIKKSTAGEFCTKTAGFLLTGTDGDMEEGTKIINCIANSTISTQSSSAFGIFLEPKILSEISTITSEAHGTTVFSVSWSPKEKFLAIGGNTASGNQEIRIYSFDGLSLSLLDFEEHGITVNSVSWSPNGKYCAIGGGISSTDNREIRVYSFNGSSLNLLHSEPHTDIVNSVSWSPNGKYLAIGGDTAGDSQEIRIYSFDGLSLSLLYSEEHGTNVYSVDWSPNGKYLAIGGGDNTDYGYQIRIYSFDGLSLSLLDPKGFGTIARSVDWSPSGKHLAVGRNTIESGGVTVSEIQVYSFDGSFLAALDYKTHGNTVTSVSWSPNGKYLAIGGNTADDSKEIRIYSFNGSFLTLLNSKEHGTIVYSVDWSPSGKYLAIGGETSGGKEIQVYGVMDSPSNCLIDSNKTCNSSGEEFLGYGILGGGDNSFLRNIAYNNDVNFSYGVVPLSVGIFSSPNAFDNYWAE